MVFPNAVIRVYNPEIHEVDIYTELMRKILTDKRYTNKLVQSYPDVFDNQQITRSDFERRLYDLLRQRVYNIKDIDIEAFYELLSIREILEFLVQGRVTPDDLLRESENLRTALLSIGLRSVSPSIKTNNILIA